MSTGDPRRKPVEPTGNPRVDALIDAMICPTCRTILNAKRAGGCPDLWHSDNRPEPSGSTPVSEEPARDKVIVKAPRGPFDSSAIVVDLASLDDDHSRFREQALADPETREAYIKARVAAAHARGVSKGLRQAAEDAARLTAWLHRRFLHPDFKYDATTGPRKAWDQVDEPPEGEGWERNVDAGRQGWERFDYHEESYWRRLKPDAPCPDLAHELAEAGTRCPVCARLVGPREPAEHPERPEQADGQRFTDTLGVSAIVRIRRPDSIVDGDIGMVFEQRAAGAHRYGALIPGCPLPIWYRAEDLEVLQGIDTEGWWHRD